MLEIVNQFPVLSASVFVVTLMSLLSLFLRRSIYLHLIESAKKIQKNRHSGIVETLKYKFKKASNILETVNTTALIDSVYSEETFNFLGFNLHCAKWDEVCRILPNLLLYFGLLGTFLGITFNLSNLSDTISQTNNIEIQDLITKIQTPLQGMGIAFISSLVAVFLSSILIIFNLKWNTHFALNKLMSLLEDYLDNELHPSIDGYTRMDKAINKMVEQQNDFLIRFHEKVGQVIESTMGKTADKMVIENAKSNELAREAYHRLLESSGTFSQAATTFQQASNLLKQQVNLITQENKKFVEAAHSLPTISHNFSQSSQIFNQAAEKIEKSKFSDNLERLTTSLATTQAAFSQSTTSLSEILPEITTGNLKANQLAIQIYQEFQKSTGILQESAITYLESAEIIKNSDFTEKLGLIADNFGQNQVKFSKSTEVLHQGLKSLDSIFINLNNSIEKLQESTQQQQQAFLSLHKNIVTQLKSLSELEKQQISNLEKHSTQLINSEKNNQQGLKSLDTVVVNLNNSIEKLRQSTQQQQQDFLGLHKNIITQLKSLSEVEKKQGINLEKYSTQLIDSEKNNQKYLIQIAQILESEINNITKLQKTAEIIVKSQKKLGY